MNLEPAESRINQLSIDELQRLGIPLDKPAELNSARAIDRERHLLATDLENRQKLWRSFVLAAVAFLFIESWVAGRLSRKATAPAP